MNASILAREHAQAGARMAAGPVGAQGPNGTGSAVVLTFGDVPSEYRAAREGCALFDATDRGQLDVLGRDAGAFLHRMLANHVRTLEPGRGNRNLLLSPKGKVLHVFDLFAFADRLAASTTPARAAALRADLDRYLFNEDVRLEDRTSSAAPLALVGPRAVEIARAVLGSAPPSDDHAHAQASYQGHPVFVAALDVAGVRGVRLDGGPELAPSLWRALVDAGARPAGQAVRDILRVEAGAAEWGADIDDNVYPQEARLEAAFALDKGCYVGQEVVAKIDTYGGLNKRLVGLRPSDDDPVARGTKLWREDEGEWRELGLTTSWSYSFVLDGGLALGYAKRRHQEPGTRFRLGDGPRSASVVELPVTSAGARGASAS